MNENNQPQSQTKRELGYYHCRWVDEWVIARWNGYEWMHEGVRVVLIFDEIDERRIERGDSPTEQPGDSANNYKCADCGTAINEGEFKTFGICDDCWDRHHKKVQPANNSDEEFKKLVMDTFHELYPYSSGPHLNELFILAERISKYYKEQPAPPSTSKPESGVSEEDRKRIDSYIRSHPDGGDFELYVRLKDIAEKVTEYERRDKAVLRAAYDELEKQWRDINRKQAELVAENARLKAECSSHEKERYEIYSFDSSQAMEIKALQKELEQIRSERDKMREALKISKSWVSQITNVYLEEGRDKIVSIIESVLSGGSKQ